MNYYLLTFASTTDEMASKAAKTEVRATTFILVIFFGTRGKGEGTVAKRTDQELKPSGSQVTCCQCRHQPEPAAEAPREKYLKIII